MTACVWLTLKGCARMAVLLSSVLAGLPSLPTWWATVEEEERVGGCLG